MKIKSDLQSNRDCSRNVTRCIFAGNLTNVFRLLFISGLLLVSAVSVNGETNEDKAFLAKDVFEAELEKVNADLDSIKKEAEESFKYIREQIQEINTDQNHNIQELQTTLRQFASEVQNLANSVQKQTSLYQENIGRINEAIVGLKRLETKMGNQFSAFKKEADRKFEAYEKQTAGKQDMEKMKAEFSRYESKLLDFAAGLEEAEAMLSKVRKQASAQFASINRNISRQTLYWIIAILLVTVMTLSLFLVLKTKLTASASNLDQQIHKTKEVLDAEAVKLDSKLIDILEKQLNIAAKEKEKPPAPKTNGESADHSLPLKTGLEIHRMRKRIENMPEGVKGLKALRNSLSRLESEYNENGYQIVDLIGKPYVDGLSLKARFIPSDEMKSGEQVITKVIKPQINHDGVMIHPAEVEVSTGD